MVGSLHLNSPLIPLEKFIIPFQKSDSVHPDSRLSDSTADTQKSIFDNGDVAMLLKYMNEHYCSCGDLSQSFSF